MAARRSGPRLRSDPVAIDDHRVRLFLAEKGIRVRIEWAGEPGGDPELARANPYEGTPTLLDRDLVLYGTRAILEYVDERYPHPPFMPVDPVSRAGVRLALHRIETDWYSLLPEPTDLARRDAPHAALGESARIERLRTSLVEADDVFAAKPFFLGDAWSMLDATVVPLLWRLPRYGIVRGDVGPALSAYAKRMFERPAMALSLSAAEREMKGP